MGSRRAPARAGPPRLPARSADRPHPPASRGYDPSAPAQDRRRRVGLRDRPLYLQERQRHSPTPAEGEAQRPIPSPRRAIAVLLGHGSSQLAAQAQEAVGGFSNPDDPTWAFGDLAGSQCNLALVRLHAGDLDGAADAIRPVLDLSVSLRNNGIVVSAARVRHAVTVGPVRDAILARDLREEIALFEPARRPALPR